MGDGFSLYLFYFNLVEVVKIWVIVICGEWEFGGVWFWFEFYCKLVGGFIVLGSGYII